MEILEIWNSVAQHFFFLNFVRWNPFHYIWLLEFLFVLYPAYNIKIYFGSLETSKSHRANCSLALLYVYSYKIVSGGLPLMTVTEGIS